MATYVQVMDSSSGISSISQPATWNPNNNKVEIVSWGGYGGSAYSTDGGMTFQPAVGGSGGGYAVATNINPAWPVSANFGFQGTVSFGIYCSVKSADPAPLWAYDDAIGDYRNFPGAAGSEAYPNGYDGGMGEDAPPYGSSAGGGGAAGPNGPGGAGSGGYPGAGNGGTVVASGYPIENWDIGSQNQPTWVATEAWGYINEGQPSWAAPGGWGYGNSMDGGGMDAPNGGTFNGMYGGAYGGGGGAGGADGSGNSLSSSISGGSSVIVLTWSDVSGPGIPSVALSPLVLIMQ